MKTQLLLKITIQIIFHLVHNNSGIKKQHRKVQILMP